MPEIEINDITGIATVGVTEVIAEVTVDDTELTPVVQVNVSSPPEIIEVGIIGPQGPQGPTGVAGPPGSTTLEALTDVNVTSKVDNSVLYYKESESKFFADDINTVITLTDGGNF